MVKADDEQLCCCEYVNEKQETTSVLACCCDCEAVDDTCDRMVRCGEVRGSHWDRMWTTISDRLRVPWYGGALQARVDIFLPVLLVPTAIVGGSSSPSATKVVLILIPLLMLVLYQCWRRREKRIRSQFFFAWTMTSVCTIIYVFAYTIIVLREILLWEGILLLTMGLVTFYCLYLTKLGAGIIRAPRRRHRRRKHVKQNGSIKTSGRNGFTKHSSLEKDESHGSDQHNMLFPKTRLRTFSNSEGLMEDDVTWIDSRSFKDGHLVTWCSICNVTMPPRSHHCTVCNVCIAARDHHCVWVDQCIGERNHLSFIVGLFFFLMTSTYSIHLTLTSVCTPEMYLDWFLFPSDCRFVYGDFPSAVTWVCVCYSLIPICIVIIIFIQQIITISQNVTLVELQKASARGWTRWLLFAKNNANDQGFLRNWRDFYAGKRNNSHKTSELV